MKKIKITFDSIVQMRKFQSAIEFLGFQHTINDELMEIEIDSNAIRDKYKLDITCGHVAVSFKNEE